MERMIEEIQGVDGLYIMQKAMVYKEIQMFSNFSTIKDYKGYYEIKKNKGRGE